jgi:hypothetical protein
MLDKLFIRLYFYGVDYLLGEINEKKSSIKR